MTKSKAKSGKYNKFKGADFSEPAARSPQFTEVKK
jgi:hypothetical protein